MNWIDLIIIGTVALMALSGLKSGILMPSSGVGGLVLGVVLAIQYHGQLAFVLTDHVEGEVVRRLAAFGIIVLGTTIASRVLAGLLKKLLSYLKLGWIDHVSGGAAGVALAVVTLGTAAYILRGAEQAGVQALFESSSLAAPISYASLIAAPSTWCSELEPDPSGRAPKRPTECSDFSSLASDKLGEVLGQDVETVAQVVRASLSDSPQELTSLAADHE